MKSLNFGCFPHVFPPQQPTLHGVHRFHRPSPRRAAQQPCPASHRAGSVEVGQGRRPLGGLRVWQASCVDTRPGKQKTVENHHAIHGKIHYKIYKWWFSIVMLNYQRVMKDFTVKMLRSLGITRGYMGIYGDNIRPQYRGYPLVSWLRMIQNGRIIELNGGFSTAMFDYQRVSAVAL